MHAALLILAVVLVIIFGILIVNLLVSEETFLEKLALGYVVGIGVFTFILFLSNLAGIPYTFVTSSLILIGLILIFFIINLITGNLRYLSMNISFNDLIIKLNKLHDLEKATLTIILILVFFSLLSDIYWPVKDWDSLVLYDFRAKIFPRTGFMEEAISLGYFSSYPLLTSLAHMWLYFWGAKTPLIIYNLYYISLLVLFLFITIKSNVNKTMAFVFTLILASSASIFEHSQWAYTNLPYSIYMFLGSAYSFFWIKKGNDRYLLLSAIFIGLSTWTRFAEPFWLPVTIFIVIAALIKRKILLAFLYPLVITIFRYPWRTFVENITGRDPATEQGISGMFISISKNMDSSQVSSVIFYLWSNVILKNLFLLLILLCLSVFIPKIIKNRNYSLIYLTLLIVANFSILIVGIYMFSLTWSFWKQIGDSANRMIMFFIPLILFYAPVVIEDNLIKK